MAVEYKIDALYECLIILDISKKDPTKLEPSLV